MGAVVLMAEPREIPADLAGAARFARGEADRLDAESAAAARKLLDDAIDEAERVLRSRGAISGFTRTMTSRALRGLREVLEDFEAKYLAQVGASQSGAATASLRILSARSAARLLDAGSSVEVFGGVGLETLESLSALRTDLVRGVSSAASQRIRLAVSRGVLLGETLGEVERGVSKALREPGVQGYLSGRAETIARTETLRAYSVAGDAGLGRVAAVVPGVRKGWASSRDQQVRPTHRRADGQTQEYGESYRVGNVRLRYPRDPFGQGSPSDLAAETINCRCISIAVMPGENPLLLR